MAARGHPRDWVAQACARYGEETVLGLCAALLGGRDPDDVEIDLDLLGGPGGARLVRESDVRWLPRSWAARAMRYVWCEGCEAGLAAQRALVAGLHDAHWRVRETSAAVVAVREVGAAAEALLPLLGDDVPRALQPHAPSARSASTSTWGRCTTRSTTPTPRSPRPLGARSRGCRSASTSDRVDVAERSATQGLRERPWDATLMQHISCRSETS